jgi:hypothetical protein
LCGRSRSVVLMFAPPPVVEPLMDSPIVILLAAGPPACELPPGAAVGLRHCHAGRQCKYCGQTDRLNPHRFLAELLPSAPTDATMIRFRRQLQLERKVAPSIELAFPLELLSGVSA